MRGSGGELEALSRLVASGEVALTGDVDTEERDESDASDTPKPRRRAEAPDLPAWNEGGEWGASFDAPPSDDSELSDIPTVEAFDGTESFESESESESEPEPDTERQLEPETELEAEIELEPEPETETEERS